MPKNNLNEVASDKKKYLEIINKNPNNYDALLKLGLIDIKEKNYLDAKEKFKNLLELNEKKYEAYLNLSNIYFLEGNITKANQTLKNYLNNIEEKVEIINSLAVNYINSNDLRNLESHVERYINRHESYVLYYLKGFLLFQNGKNYESEIFFKKSMAVNLVFWNNYDFLLQIYEKQSRLEDFEALIKNAKKIFENNLKLSYYESLYFFRRKKYKRSLDILINEKNKKKFISLKKGSDLADYFHLLSRVYEKLGFYSKSYNLALDRNRTILNFNENKIFKKDVVLDTVEAYKNFFKKDKSILRDKFSGIDHSNLTFLIGFPRSGTTLLDTVLRSHSKTFVLEEKPYLLDIRHNFYKNHELADILKISESEKIQIQKQYINSFEYTKDKAIIDKYPLNLIELGFIKTIFPKSKIVLAIRHPLDCIISCVMTSFKMNEAMVHFENEKTTAHFYNICFDLLFLYFKFFEIDYYLIKYENVVLNFKEEIKDLLNYLGLDFEESINDFHKTAMIRERINTPSYDQVIQPIYSSSINRHKNFNEIKNIKNEVNFWIKKFSY